MKWRRVNLKVNIRNNGVGHTPSAWEKIQRYWSGSPRIPPALAVGVSKKGGNFIRIDRRGNDLKGSRAQEDRISLYRPIRRGYDVPLFLTRVAVTVFLGESSSQNPLQKKKEPGQYKKQTTIYEVFEGFFV